MCDAPQVKVKRRGDDRKFLARVLAVGTECDIVLLTVDDDAFWEGVAPLAFGSLPHLQDAVAVVGYPIGGDTISVTSGAGGPRSDLGWVVQILAPRTHTLQAAPS